jgi:hypothetical protein
MRVYNSIELKTRRASTIAIFFAFVITGFLLGVMQSPHAATPVTVSIDFVGNGSSMGAAEIAGVVPKANWNSATGATRSTPLALKDETGASSMSTVTWTADNTWATPIADDPGNRRLMKGYLDNGLEGATSVTVAGLPGGTYDVYVYVDGDGGGSRTGSYRISGAGITTTTITLTDPGNTNFDATFTQANNTTGNYVKFSIDATGFTLTATPGPASDGRSRAPVNGIQIVSTAAPPPSGPDFTIAASPGSRTVTQGSSASYTVTIGASDGFASTVNLAVSGLPAAATASFVPASVTGSGSATLNVTTSASTPSGTSTLTMTGTSGSLVHTAAVGLVVTAASSSAIAIGIEFVGNGTSMSATESAGVVARPNWNNAAGATRSTPLALKDEAGAATGATVVWTSDNVWSTPIADQAGNARLMKGYLDTGLGNASTVTVAGLPTAAYDVYVYADGDNGSGTRTGGYQISGAGMTTTTIDLTDAAATNFSAAFVQASNSNGNYVKFGINAGGFTLRAIPGQASDGRPRAPVNGIQIVSTASPPPPSPDFTIAATPSSRTVTQGNSASYTVTVGAVNGFASTVSLAVSGLPANATASFTPASVTGSGSATLNVMTAASTPTGSPTLTITGTSGSMTHSTTVSLIVTGLTFSLSGVISPPANGASATVNLGGAATATTAADSAGNFSFSGLPNGGYAVSPSKAGFTFTPTSRNTTIDGGNVTGVDFTASQSPITVSITSPANGATVSSAFSIAATASAGVVGVQFRVDGQNAGPEDTSAPYSVSVTAPAGSHALTALARDAMGNTVTSAAVNVTVSSGSGTALTVDGAQTFQTIDGFGVNLNSLSWKNGELRPAIDMLVDQLGATIWRVVFDMEDWESPNDNSDPNTANWTYYNGLYSNAKFQNLWGTLRYLNQKGITTGIMVSFMGRVPAWMGGSVIQSNMEDEWVEMMATLFFYARNTENVQFDMIDPLNEPDWDGIEGPQVDAFQYTRLLQKLSLKLDAMGLSALRFVGPNTAQVGTGVNTYMPQMMSNSIVMSKVDHFALHNYAGDSGGADAAIKSSAYPGKNFWITEVSNAWDIMTHLGQNPSATLVWDAYDSVYNHAILAGRGSSPPNDVGNGPPLLQYDSSTGIYTRRPPFYQIEHIFRFVPKGSVRIGATESNAALQIYAFRHQVSGRLTIVGRNTGGSAISVQGSLSGLAPVSGFQFYQTSGGFYFQRGSDVVVTNGAFVFTAPSNSFFTLTTP